MSDLFDEAANGGLIRVEEARRIHEFEMERSIALDRVLRIPPPGRILLRDDEASVERLADALHRSWHTEIPLATVDIYAVNRMARAIVERLREGS